MTLALGLSFRSWVLQTSSGPRFREAVAEAKGYAERGHKLAPQSHVLVSSLGILCDLEGDHERARHYFRRGGELGIGPYWRLYASTSWGMEGKYTQALTEIEKAVEEGAKGWIVDSYHGRALNSLARYDEAFPYLYRAYAVRGLRPELLRELEKAANFSGRLLAAVKYDCLLGLAMLRFSPRRGVVMLFKATSSTVIALLCVLSKKLWRFTQRLPIIGRLHGRLVPPEEPEVTILHDLAEREEYEAALILAKRALRIRPNKVDNHQIVIMLLINTRNRDEATTTCDRAIERWPDYPPLRALRHTIAEKDYIFRCVPLQAGGHGWQVAERNPNEKGD
jgi:tetratricopeptide (TPR) repeat protein